MGRASLRAAPSTKENRKGHARSYKYRRRPVILTSCALTSIVLFILWRTSVKSQLGHEVSLFKGDVKLGRIANKPIRDVEYGAQGQPVVMIRASLGEELHTRFLKEHLYSCSEEELNRIPELDNRVKEPTFVYEGYYHSMTTDKEIYSRNPNPLIGKDFDKPAASLFTRAFYDAFRLTNADIFERLKHELLQASSFNSTNVEDVCYLFAKWIEKGVHFGDLSIQIHYGKGNEAKLESGAAWHTDAENSLLHLAITLRGSRVLHSRRTRGRDAALRKPTQASQTPKEVLERQNPADVYLSSSTLMRHAPQFFDTDYSERVIAIHARILYTTAEIDHFRSVRTKKSWDKLTSVLANVLVAADLQMPSLAQVITTLITSAMSFD